jgi:periplasmic protein TonB
MASAATIRRPAAPPDSLGRFLWFSAGFHAVIVGLLIYSTFVDRSGNSWGGPGGSITVGVVGNVPAIPLPHPTVASTSRVVDNTNGLYKSEPPEITPPPADAVQLPKFKSKMPPPPKYKSRPSKLLENPTPPPTNAVPYGAGGTPTIPTTSFAIGQGTTQAGLGFTGVSGGDFGSRFAYYVQAVQQRISRNWLQSTVDPGFSVAPRVVVTFDILRNGSITNIQVTQSSNNYSVDSSALRAVQNSSPLQPLPAEYSGSRVTCEFWFDYRR